MVDDCHFNYIKKTWEKNAMYYIILYVNFFNNFCSLVPIVKEVVFHGHRNRPYVFLKKLL
jgi:hypothetical protein